MTITRADILNELAKIAFADVRPGRRRHRERRRDGLKCLTIELRATKVEGLIDRGLLKPETRNDLNAVRDALYAHLDRTLGTTPGGIKKIANNPMERL
jgi:hypothetical protein